MQMKTDFDLLVSNTNLPLSDILTYYEEEITKELNWYRNMYWSRIYLGQAKLEGDEELEEQESKCRTLIIEFTEFVKYIITKYDKNNRISYKIMASNAQLNFEAINCGHDILYHEDGVDVRDIIKDLLNEIYKYKLLKKEQSMVSKEEKKNIQEFYIAELNRMLDEKESRINNLESKNIYVLLFKEDKGLVRKLVKENN